jgi:hypothetical protein
MNITIEEKEALKKEFDYVWKKAIRYATPCGASTSCVYIPHEYFVELQSLANRIHDEHNP